MAQKRFTTFKAAVESFPLGEMQIGLLKPGRFNGFDNMTSNGGLSVDVNHSALIRKTTKAGAADNAFGAIIMPTGVVIHENTSITLSIVSNGANAEIRKDLLICEHNYQEIQSGTLATYSIIQGPNASDIRPVLTDPTKQVIVGEFLTVANGTTFADITYTPETAPLPGDMDAADIYAYIQTLVQQEITNTGSAGVNVGAGPGLVYKDNVGGNINMRTLKSSDNSVAISVSGDEIDLKAGTPNNVVEINAAISLSNNLHNGKTLRITGNGYDITIPAGLPAGFECFFYISTNILPSLDGIYPHIVASPTNINFVAAAGVKARSPQGNVMMAAVGSVYIQGTGVVDYYDLMGDLTV